MTALMSSVILTSALVLGMQGPSPLTAVSAAHPDFTGTWVLDVAGSDFGMSPRADSGVTVISRADDHLVMFRTTYAALGQHGHLELDMPIDGAIRDGVGAAGVPIPASAQWDGDALVLTVIGQSNVGEIEIVDHMAIDGHVLRIERAVLVPGVPGLTQSLVMRRRS